MKYLMVIDAVTGYVRAVIFDTKGNQISVSQQEWIHNSISFDTQKNWELTAQ